MSQPDWAVQSTATKRYMPIYKKVIKEWLLISAGGYFSPWLQCSVLTYIPPQHSNTDTPEPLREGCKVLPDDFPKVQINLCSLSITDYILWADPAATPTSPTGEVSVLCCARAVDTSSFSTQSTRTPTFPCWAVLPAVKRMEKHFSLWTGKVIN